MKEAVVVTYRIETSNDPKRLAAKIASDQSTGTFVPVPGETPELKARVAARVLDVRLLEPVSEPGWGRAHPGLDTGHRFNRADVDIAYPVDAVGTDLSALMTITIGGVWSIKELSGVRVTAIQLPPSFAGAHPGPQFGIEGSRRLTGVHGRPLVGTIVKPALGLRPHETAAMVRELVEAGVDFIKDDEKLMSPAYSSLEDRVKAIMPVILEHEQRTGKKVMYAFGISAADPDTMLRNHDVVAEAGGNAAVVNFASVGLGGLVFLRKRSRLVLHGHRNGWDILTRNAAVGMDFAAWEIFWRLSGIDQFQINGIRAKYWEPDESFVRSFKALQRPVFGEADRPMPVVCSGQWGGQAPDTYAATGGSIDLLYLCGGGVVSHPDGPAAGVRAVHQAWEATVAGIDLRTFAEDHPELARSIETFGDGRLA